MPKTFKFLRWSGKKAVAFLVLTLVLAVAAVGSTLAYIIVKTNSLENQFTPPNVDIVIVGDGIENTGDVIENTGDVPVYVRAAIVMNWVDENGNILSTAPVLDDMTFNEGWVRGSDGFYYYTSALHPNEEANELIKNAKAPTNVPAGYKLRIQVLASAIQATPDEAVVESWTAVTAVENGKLVIKEVTE